MKSWKMENTEKKYKLERKNSQHLKKPCLRRAYNILLGLFPKIVFVDKIQFFIKFKYKWWEVRNFHIHDFVI